MEEVDLSVKLHSILTKIREPLGSVRLEAEVFGMYGLPEAWTQGDSDFTYTLTLSGLQFSGGKIMKREPSEEELKAQEQGKKKQAPPAKGKVVEPTAEELEAIERERQLKEEEEAKRKAEWDALTEDERYFKTMEDIHKNAFLLWEEEKEGDERKFKTVTVTKAKEALELVELEEAIEDDGGLWLEFARAPPTVEEDQKKKAKAKPGEEAKPTFGRGWVDAGFFRNPAAQETILRVELKDPEPKSEEPVEAPFFNAIRSYVYLRIKLDPAVTPSIPETPYTVITDLIPPKPPVPKFAASIDASHDFRRQVKLAAKSIAAEYDEKFRESSDQDAKKGTIAQQKEEREKRKQTFLYEFNISGKAQALKEKFKKSIVKIAREKFRKEETLTGLSFDNKDRYFSELYAFLVEQMHFSVDEVMSEKRAELHDDLTSTRDQMNREKEQLLSLTTKETTDERFMRLVGEYELVGDVKQAEQYMQQRACLQERNASVWLDYARFCLRHGDITRAEECLKEVISLSGPDVTVEHMILFASLLLQRGRPEEARFYLHAALDKDFYHVPANLITSLLYLILGQESLSKKYMAIAKQLTMRHLGLLSKPVKKGGKSGPNPSLQHTRFRVLTAQGEYPNALTLDQVDDLNYVMFEYFLNEKLLHLAGKCAELIAAKETSIARYNFYIATIHYWKGEYEKCSEILTNLLEFEPRYDQGWVLRGHSQFHLGNHYDAEECYLKALRYAPRGGRKDSRFSLTLGADYSVHQRLGQIYMKRRAWKDARQVFLRCCEESPTAFAWQGLGIACLRLSLYGEAEDSLNQANMLDDKNPSTWLFLGLLCLQTTDMPPGRYMQARQCFVQALKNGANDPSLWLEVANLHVTKFFLDGAGPSFNKQDIAEALQYYQLSTQLFSTQAKPVGYMASSIAKTFDALKEVGDNKLDSGLLQVIEEKKAEALKACGFNESEA